MRFCVDFHTISAHTILQISHSNIAIWVEMQQRACYIVFLPYIIRSNAGWNAYLKLKNNVEIKVILPFFWTFLQFYDPFNISALAQNHLNPHSMVLFIVFDPQDLQTVHIALKTSRIKWAEMIFYHSTEKHIFG